MPRRDDSDDEAETGVFSRWWKKLTKKPPAPEPEVRPTIDNVDVEAAAKQKRAWLEQQAELGTVEHLVGWPAHLVEGFYVVGLPPDTEVTQIAYDLLGQEKAAKETSEASHTGRPIPGASQSSTKDISATAATSASLTANGSTTPLGTTPPNNTGAMHLARALSRSHTPRATTSASGAAAAAFAAGPSHRGSADGSGAVVARRRTADGAADALAAVVSPTAAAAAATVAAAAAGDVDGRVVIDDTLIPPRSSNNRIAAHDRPPTPAYPATVLFRYPYTDDTQQSLSDQEVAELCFPNQVTPRRLRRSPSWSALYGVINHRANIALGTAYMFMVKRIWPDCTAPYRQCLITAPRCYCITSHYPFFNVLTQALNLVVGLERLNRSIAFTKELTCSPQPCLTSHHPTHTATTAATQASTQQAAQAAQPAAQLAQEQQQQPAARTSSNSAQPEPQPAAPASDTGIATAPVSETAKNEGGKVSEAVREKSETGSEGKSETCDESTAATAAQGDAAGDSSEGDNNNSQAVTPRSSSGADAAGSSSAEPMLTLPPRAPSRRTSGDADDAPAQDTAAAAAAAGCGSLGLHRRDVSVCSFYTAADGGIEGEYESSGGAGGGSGSGGTPTSTPGGVVVAAAGGAGAARAAGHASTPTLHSSRKKAGRGAAGSARKGTPTPTSKLARSGSQNGSSRAGGGTGKGPVRPLLLELGTADNDTRTDTTTHHEATNSPTADAGDLGSAGGEKKHGGTSEGGKGGGVGGTGEEEGLPDGAASPVRSAASAPDAPGTPAAQPSPPLHPPRAATAESVDLLRILPVPPPGHEPDTNLAPSTQNTDETAAAARQASGGDTAGVLSPSQPAAAAASAAGPLQPQSQSQTEPATQHFSPLSVIDAMLQAPVPTPGDYVQIPLDGLPSLPLVCGRWVLTRRWPVVAPAPALAAYAEDELTAELAPWATAVLARCLGTCGAFFSKRSPSALLERSIVFFHPDPAMLTSAVLGVLPMLRPFTWQCVVMPMIPSSTLSLLEAPVPFLAGCQYKTPEISARCTGHVRVNLYKGSVSNAGSLPPIPGLKRLTQRLTPLHDQLRAMEAAYQGARAPDKAGCVAGHTVPEDQMHIASAMLWEIYVHLAGAPIPTLAQHTLDTAHSDTPPAAGAGADASAAHAGGAGAVAHAWAAAQPRWAGVVGDLPPHMITHLGSDGKRTATLLWESLLEAQGVKDRPWVKSFLDTQLFQVYSDQVMAAYCEGRRWD